VAELFKFCLLIDKEFGGLLGKVSGARQTMELVYLSGMRAKRLQRGEMNNTQQ